MSGKSLLVPLHANHGEHIGPMAQKGVANEKDGEKLWDDLMGLKDHFGVERRPNGPSNSGHLNQISNNTTTHTSVSLASWETSKSLDNSQPSLSKVRYVTLTSYTISAFFIL